MKPRIVFVVCVIGLLLFSLEGFAEVDSQDEKSFAVVVTGSRLPVESMSAKANMQIITREEIQRQNPRSVTQLLQGVAGLHIESSGARGGIGAVYLRGAEPNYTLVLIDGVSVNDPTNSRGGAFDFSLLDVNNIEKIEIVKGPASFAYGSTAMAGVINIVTHKALEAPKTILKMETGSNGLMNLNVSTGRISEETEISLSASYQDDGEQVKGSEYKAKTVSLSGILDVSSVTELSFNARYQDASAEAFPEASGGDSFAVLRDVDQRDSQYQQLAVSLKHQMNGGQHLQFDINGSNIEEELHSPGVDTFIPENESTSDYERYNATMLYRIKPTRYFQASVGGALEKEEGESRGQLDMGGFVIPTQFDLERDAYAIFAETEYRPRKDIVWSMGARVDKPDELDEEISPHVAVSYQYNATQYKLSWGEGFKLPSFFALGHPLVGNPDFGSETNESVDFTVMHELTPKTTFEVTAFHNQYFDLIDFGDSGVLVSRDEVVITGIELGASSEVLEGVSVSANFSALSMDIKDSNEMLHKRPKRSGGLSVNLKASHRVDVSFGANYVGEVRDFSYPTGEKKLAAYTRVDAAMSWNFMKDLDGLVAIDNLLNKKYDETIGSEAAGTVLRVGIQGTL